MKPRRGTCRRCGCTEKRACVDRVGDLEATCFWVDRAETRYSFCYRWNHTTGKYETAPAVPAAPSSLPRATFRIVQAPPARPRKENNLPMPTLRAPMLELLRQMCGPGGHFIPQRFEPCPSCECDSAIGYAPSRNELVYECFRCGATVRVGGESL